MSRSLVSAACALLLAFAGAGCSARIGDSCQSATDCSTDGSRICDTAEPGGYCTIEGCTPTSCPSEAACIRFFPGTFLTTPCNPATENAAPAPGVTPTHDCLDGEVCLDEGVCAPQAAERRFCMLRCNINGDCRGGYVCRETGFDGAETVPQQGAPDTPVKFCAPAP